MEFYVEEHPDPRELEVLETGIRREASATVGLGEPIDLAIFVRHAGRVVAGISGWTLGDSCERLRRIEAALNQRSQAR